MSVFLVIAIASVALSALVDGVVNDQERTILHERASELSLLLNETVANIGVLLPVAGAAASSGASSNSSFQLVAKSLIGAGTSSVEVFAQHGRAFDVVAKAGPGAPVTVMTREAGLLRRAAATPGLVTGLIHASGNRWLVLAVATDGKLVVDQTELPPVTASVPAKNSPFSDVNLALYASATADRSALFVVSGAMPSGPTDHVYLDIGRDRWLLVVSANQPLVGSVAESSPWVLLLVGLLLALLAGSLVEGLARRRSYALKLVDERTATLEEALVVGRQLQEIADRARQEAESANRYKSEFISRMSHELRTPLNAVVGFAQLLELEELNDEQRDSVEHITKGGKHLLKLVNEVLDIARIEAGDIALSPEPVLVSDTLSEVVALIRPLAEQRSIRVLSAPDACAEYVLADRHRLQQVLLNLLSNAVKYNQVGGSITVSCESIGVTRLRLKVADTGKGVSNDQLERIFTPFDRLGAERTGVEGTGIGLSLSRQLVEAMGGLLGLESVEGVGSTFWVELPIVEGPVDRYERLGGIGRVERDDVALAARHTVLHIENNLANVSLVQRIVERREGIEIIPAMLGRLGLQLAREHLPVLILLDRHLPDISGDEVLLQLRRDPATSSIPVVMISADATPGQVQRLLNAGALAYLTKPIDVNDLLRILDECLVSEVGSHD
ncbi:MAG: ATP-binding protein [Acidimicrobiales bacterium]